MAPAPQGLLPLELLPRLCTAGEMRRMDDYAIENLGLPSRLLMENAASAVVHALVPLLLPGNGRVVVCCGNGNNGGDGYAIARQLANRGVAVTVLALGRPGGGDAAANRAAFLHGGEVIDFSLSSGQTIPALQDAGAVVDALFGTGLSRPLEGAPREMVAAINAAPAPVKLAVDLPSGIDADTGAVLGCAVRCTHTVALQVGKVGCYQHPGAEYAGAVTVAPISIPVSWEKRDTATYLLTAPFVRLLLPHRPPAGHKGTFGHLLALCGSAGMGGAALLAGRAALKSGAGLVTMGVPLGLRDTFLAEAPELLTLSSEAGESQGFAGEDAEFFLAQSTSRSAALLGCGLGQRKGAQAFVAAMVEGLRLPLLVDADGLNLLSPGQLQARQYPTVITPHPGEFARLTGLGTQELAADRVGHARRFAALWGVVLVLKGAGTVVAAPEGEVFINPTGDQGLATAGTGDVLSGLIGGLLAQGIGPLAAALAGVYWHGLARDCRADKISATAFTAGDLIEGINEAMLQLQQA